MAESHSWKGSLVAKVLLLLLAWQGNANAAAVGSLASHAEAWARAQRAGATVTAERIGGRWEYALGGAPFPADTSALDPERIIFEIGSISKVFTALLLAHAVLDGKLTLQDTLGDRLPVEFEAESIAGITLQQLASHTSCLPRLPDNLTSATDVDPYATYDDLTLLSYLQHARLTSSPPCSANYSNLGFGVLGLVLERAYSRSWEALVQERISRPLGLVDTAQRLTDEQKGRLAQGWSGVQPARPWTFQAMAGAGALHSSAADLAKLADAILAGEKGPLGQAWALLSRAEVDAPGLGGKIGLALVHEQIDGVDGYSHGGATGGYAALMQAFPSSGQAYVVLASNSEAQPAAWLSSLRAESRPALERHEVSLPITLLDEYVGVYAFPPQAHFTVLRSDGGLLIRLTGQPFLPIYASAKDAFFYRAVDALISFQRDSEGKITGLVLHQNGRHLPATRTTDRVPQIVFPTPEVLAQYVGDYDFGSYIPGSSISVQASAGGLGVQISGQPMLPVFGTTRRDHFEYDVVPAALSFERDAAGRVIAVVLHQNGADMRAPRK